MHCRQFKLTPKDLLIYENKELQENDGSDNLRIIAVRSKHRMDNHTELFHRHAEWRGLHPVARRPVPHANGNIHWAPVVQDIILRAHHGIPCQAAWGNKERSAFPKCQHKNNVCHSRLLFHWRELQ